MSIAARNAILAGGAALPYDAEVEYLYIGVTRDVPYIDTGVIITGSTIEIEVDAAFTLSGAINTTFCCMGCNESAEKEIAIATRRTTSGIYYYMYAFGQSKNEKRGNARHLYKVSVADGVAHWVVDGQETGSAEVVCSDNTLPILMFAWYNRSGVIASVMHGGKIYGARIALGGSDVFNCIPVRFTNENGVTEGAMFDKVSGTLFRNAGADAFMIGPDK